MVIQLTETLVDDGSPVIKTKVTVINPGNQFLYFYLEDEKDDIVVERDGNWVSIRKIVEKLAVADNTL